MPASHLAVASVASRSLWPMRAHIIGVGGAVGISNSVTTMDLGRLWSLPREVV